MKFKKYHKIPQFKDVVKTITKQSDFKGFDEDGNVIVDRDSVKPIITAKGTVKLHGTNAGISYFNGEVRPLKRSSFIKLSDDNSHFGFSQFVFENKESFVKLFEELIKENTIPNGVQVTIYGEWAGQDVQKNVGISNIVKSFFLFDAKYTFIDREFEDNEEESVWLNIEDVSTDIERCYNIYDFETFEIEIDFNDPHNSVNKMIDITNKVEELCPVANKLGYKGIGEGVVYHFFYNGIKHKWKVKGEKHSVTKVKKLVEVDLEYIKSMNDFIDFCVTENRINSIKDIKTLISWTINDIFSEEMSEIQRLSLKENDVKKEIGKRVVKIYRNNIYI